MPHRIKQRMKMAGGGIGNRRRENSVSIWKRSWPANGATMAKMAMTIAISGAAVSEKYQQRNGNVISLSMAIA